MNVLIVCHAGTGIGLGHLTRCLAVARTLLREFDVEICFLIQGDSIEHPELQRVEHRFVPVDGVLTESIERFVQQSSPSFVIFDLYPGLIPNALGNLLQDLRRSGCKIIAVDGLLVHRDYLDLIFMPSFHFSVATISNLGAPIVFGWDCFLLNARNCPKPWQQGNKVLILTGGCDVAELGQSLPTMLSKSLPKKVEVNWVTGPYAKQPILPKSGNIMIINHQAPSCLDELMIQTQYAVTVYGVSFFELLYYGIPTVVFSPYGNKDDEELSLIASEKIALVAENERDAVEKLKALMADSTLALSLSEAAKRKMATANGQRFVQSVAALLN